MEQWKDEQIKTCPFSLRSISDDTSSLVMTLLLVSPSADIRVCTALQAVAMVSSDFPISLGPREMRLVSTGSICFAREKKQETHSASFNTIPSKTHI